MKKLNRIKWLLLTAAATLFLSGCANFEQKTQDFIQDLSQDVNAGFFKLFQTINVFQLSLFAMLMEIPQC